MASGSSGRPSSGSKGFDFGSDDILCDYGNQDSSNGNSHSDPVIGAGSGKEFHKSRMARSAIFPAPVYSQQEDSFDQDVISTVEKSMKKYADNLMRFLEGISSRLSQLELYCYNLDKSIGEMRSDLTRDHGDADTKLKSLEKHLQEVHRSVQILRDKQELAETQKELAKLQLVQKESSSSSHSQSNEDRASPPSSSDPKRSDDASEAQNQQLALALPHQVAPQQQSMAPPQVPSQNVNQQQSYYLPPSQFTTPQVQSQVPQSQYLSSDPQYRTSQLQDPTRVAPQPVQSQVNQTPASQPFQVNQTPANQPFPQYQQQWSQQLPQQVAPPQQPTLQSQNRPPPTYPPYQPNQPTNPSPPETLPNSMPMQMPFPGIPQPGPSRADTVPYGYGGTGRTAQQQPLPQQPPPQQLKGTFGAQPGDGYGAAGPHPGNAYMMYDSEGGRAHHPHQPHFQQSGYPPSNSQTNSGTMVRNPSHQQFARNHPYNELIEKLVNMGFRGDHVVNVIQRMEESGQPVDFNGVLDRLNVHSSGAPQRGWSG